MAGKRVYMPQTSRARYVCLHSLMNLLLFLLLLLYCCSSSSSSFFVVVGLLCSSYLLSSFSLCPLLDVLGSPFLLRFLCMWQQFQAVTICLHGRNMQGVLLLPAFTHLGHEYQDLLSQCDRLCACTARPWFIPSFRGAVGNTQNLCSLQGVVSTLSFLSLCIHFFFYYLEVIFTSAFFFLCNKELPVLV